MLVTVSGMVGSGKSTAVAHIVSLLRREGVPDVEAWNFQTLPCFSARRADARGRTAELRQPGHEARGHGYTRRRLTAPLALGYAWRAVAFRLYRRRHPGTHVCNRYFFDNFSHFHLTARSERCWLAFVRLLVPRPDLAILMVASPGTIASRRPMYSREYLTQVGTAYDSLQRLFPVLQPVPSEADGSFDALDSAVEQLAGQKLT